MVSGTRSQFDKNITHHSSGRENTDVKPSSVLSAWKSVESKRKLSATPSVGTYRNCSEKRKRWETGVLRRYATTVITLFFENSPIWLLSLEPYFVEELRFPQFASFSDLRKRIVNAGKLFVELLSKFDTSIFKFNGKSVSDNSLSDSGVLLVSGSLTFAKDTVLKRLNSFVSPVLFIMDTHCRMRKLSDFRIPLTRVKHSQCGGATKFETIFSCLNTTIVPPTSPLKRDIGAFLDFSRYARPCDDDDVGELITQYDLLPIGIRAFSSQIIVECRHSASGFGKRKLGITELAVLFGLPRFLHTGLNMQDFPIVPVHILDFLLYQCLSGTDDKVYPRKRIRLPSVIPDDAPVLLPSLNRILPNTWAHSNVVDQQAAKNDDAEIDFSKWDLRILSLWPRATFLIPSLRTLMLRWQFRRLYREYITYLHSRFGLAYAAYLEYVSKKYVGLFHKRLRGVTYASSGLSEIRKVQLHNIRTEISYGRQCLSSYLNSSFFAWERGSTLLYWRWSSDLQKISKLGFNPCIIPNLPNSHKRANKPKSEIFNKILSKVSKALDRQYMKITPKENVKNLIDYFGVAKGESDIRVVFNGTSCGLNDQVWAPNFWLPTAKSMIRSTSYNYKFVDIDLGEMFLNFPLNKQLIPYSGVDLTPFKDRLIEDKILSEKYKLNNFLYATWQRDWMGFKPSPEWACRFYYFAEEFVRGNEEESSNPLYWKNIVLNLMGNENFNPALPTVYKWDDIAQKIAGEIKAYVDDLRTIGRTLEHAWSIARLVAARLQYLGIQDAPRKRRVDNGPWAGTVFNASPTQIQTTVTALKWKKGKDYINFISNEIKDNPECTFEFKQLERIRGFLCHLGMTFDIIFPYLKGFHLTLCSHLPRRNEEGWKRTDLEFIGFLEERFQSGRISSAEFELEMNRNFDPKNQPKRIKPVPRFYSCLKALKLFFSVDSPPIVTHRSSNFHLLAYGFADASKGGFGASIDYETHSKFRVGVWGKDSEEESSNFREFCNIVETIENEVKIGKLKNGTLIMATDNSTVEAALYKGNSSSEKLFELVIRFRHAELQSGGKFLVTHVSGNRMKSQGTDGISRGEMKEGVSVGEFMLQYCPWGKNALERSPYLKSWIEDTFGNDVEFLKPEDWYRRGHDHYSKFKDEKGFWRIKTKPGTFIWTPPPAAADAAFEELRKARLKRQQSTHIILVPRLMTTLWLKQLIKTADILIYLPNQYQCWTHAMHEPLVIAFCFPFLKYRPWQIKNTPKMCATSRELQKMFAESTVDPGNLLHKLFHLGQGLPSMSEHMVQRLLYFGSTGKVPQTQPSSTTNKRKRSRPPSERLEKDPSEDRRFRSS